jgi:HK97 family phage major capsid protein
MHAFDVTLRPGGRAVAFAQALLAAENNRERAAAWVAGRGFRFGDSVISSLKASPVGDSAAPGDALTAASIDLIAASRPLSVAGKMQALGYLRALPLHTRLIGIGVGATATFTREGQSIPLSKIDWAQPQTLTPGKVGTIVVLPRESLESAAVAEAVRVELVNAIGEAEDRAMFDPLNVGADGAPPSLTSTGALVPSTGVTVAAVDADLRAAIDALAGGGSTLAHAVWVVDPIIATRLAGLRGASGDPAFPGISLKTGGTLLGIPVIISWSASGVITLVDGDAVAFGDDGECRLSVATSATLEMTDAPAGAVLPPTAGEVQRVSMFQAGAVGIKAVRRVAWLPRRAVAAATITGIGA